MIDRHHCQAEIFKLLREAKSFCLSPQGEMNELDHDALLKVVKSLTRCRAFRVDSREVEPGDVFLAVAGKNVCGSAFVPKIAEMADFLLFSDEDWHRRDLKQWFFHLSPQKKKKIAEKCIVVDSKKVDFLACALPAPFYRYPSRRLYLTGVSGTNGKTSLCYLLERLYERQFSVGVIGTIGARFSLRERKIEPNIRKKKVKRFSLRNTTPDAAVLQHLLATMADAGVQMVFLEVSSHALALGRTQGLQLDSLLWTNFTAEHLDFHPTVRDYFDAKSSIFSLLKDKKSAFAVVGTKGLKGFDFAQKISNVTAPIFALSGGFFGEKKEESLHLNQFSGHFFYESFKNSDFSHNVRFSLSPGKIKEEQQRQCSLSADFFGAGAAENLSLALLHRYFYKMVNRYGKAKVDLNFFDEQTLQKDLNQLKKLSVPGRMRRVDNYPIYIDYAHTPDALAMALQTMRDEKRKLIVIFGCGGNRDKEKRREMGEKALRLADVIIVTSDNPRYENPLDIITDILSKMSLGYRESKQKQLVVIPNRQQAIAYGVSFLTNEHDEQHLILLAGKGHEMYQIVHSERKIFDEKKIVKNSFLDFLSNRFFLSEMVCAFGAAQLLLAGKSCDGSLLSSNELSFVKKHWREKIYCFFFSLFSGIFTDTRTEKKGEIFFAFDGEKYSAIDFIDKAFELGAKVFIVDERHSFKMRLWSKKNPESVVVLVKNVFEAYGRLAKYKMKKIAQRSKIPHCRMGVTGSAGKSGMKEILRHTLASHYNVFASEKNYNNHVGVPHNIFSIRRFYDVYIFEMGMNHLGEIATLAKMIRPHIVVLTNIFSAHAQNFRSVQEIAQAKAEFFPYGAFDGTLGKSAKIEKSAKNNTFHPAQIFFSRHIDFCQFFCQQAKKMGWEMTLVEEDFFSRATLTWKKDSLWTNVGLASSGECLKIKGVHPYAHQLFALVYQVAIFLHLRSKKILKALDSLPENVMPRRFEVVKKKPLLIDDSYNANPTSMFSSLDFIVQSSLFTHIKGKFFFVLGEMLELGEKSSYFHETLVRFCLTLGVQYEKAVFLFYGKVFLLVRDEIFEEKNLKKQRNFIFLPDQASLIHFLQKNLQKRDAVYFKASNAVNLKSIVDKTVTLF